MDSLDSLARKKGLRFGSALGGRGLRDPNYVALVESQSGMLVPENELKMAFVQRAPGEFHFERAEALLAFAENRGLLMRGHTLLWHHPKWLPQWLATYDFGPQPATAAAEMLRTHVRKTSAHFGKRICSWDVVNEAVHQVTGEMRDTVLSRAIGTPDQVVEIAFRAARQQLPNTELIYNDYMGWEKDGGPHRDGVLRLLERLRRNGVPVDALGIQAHIGAGNQDSNANRIFDARDERAWRRFLKEVTGMGYGLLVTELDVHDAPLAADTARRDGEVAALGRAFLDLTLDFREVNAVLCWGLADHYSWLQGRTPRGDGLPKRPTPYDAQLQPKPLREAVAAALRAAPSRRPAVHLLSSP
ncbi:MAG TPA: endo-1,4-beta-xylanase [Steroidobacteraceae bacterium]|nr:endo-1,4-beta-xylanase [Steroidobacteraceae bacterium]